MADRQRFSTSGQQHAHFFKYLARGATDHRGSLRIVTVVNRDVGVAGFSLAPRKRLKAAQKGELRAALHPEDFGIVWIGVGTKENNGGGVFGDYANFLTVTGLNSQD